MSPPSLAEGQAAAGAARGAVRVERNPDATLAHQIELETRWIRGAGEVRRRFALDPLNHWVARSSQGDVLGACAVTVYPGGPLAWIGGMYVRPSARRQGLARRLLLSCLDDAHRRGAPLVGLDATDEGRPLYESEGFRHVTTTTRWSRPSALTAPAPPTSPRYAVYPFSAPEILDIHAYDRQRFGANRAPWLAEVVGELPHRAFVAFDRETGRAAGFALGQEEFIGPLVADDPLAAAVLLHACEQAGTPPRLHILDDHTEATRLLRAAGYRPETARCHRMVHGGTLPYEASTQYGVAAWALG